MSGYTHPHALIREYTAGVLRARAAYAEQTTCRCGATTDPIPNRRPPLCPDCKAHDEATKRGKKKEQK